MKLSELQDKKTNSKIIEFNGQKIKVNKYIPETYKLYIAQKIKDIIFGESIIKADGNSELGNDLSNKSLKHSLFVTHIIKFYTDVEIDIDDSLQICDLVVESGLYSKVVEIIPSIELNALETIINEAITEEENRIKEENNFENYIKTFLTNLQDKLPSEDGMKEIINSLPKIINDANPENLKFIKEAIAFNNGIKPNRQQRRQNIKENKSKVTKEE